MDKLQALLAAHHEFTCSAGLVEAARPYSVQSNLSKLQDLIMKEIEKIETSNSSPQPKTDDNDIPF